MSRSSAATRRCSICNDGTTRPASIFETMLSVQPTFSASSRIRMPASKRACLTRAPICSSSGEIDAGAGPPEPGGAAVRPAAFAGAAIRDRVFVAGIFFDTFVRVMARD
jgi:hypothetical protein